MITFEEPIIENEEKKLLYDAIEKSSVAQGEYVKKFEDSCSKYFGSKFACASFNGTTALHLAVAALGIGKENEVIVPSFTFIATANVVSYVNAKPVFADIKKDTLCIDPSSIRKKITNKTKAIIPVHAYGNLCDMDEIRKIAKEKNLYVVEDACEAHGALYRGKMAGSISDIGCLSFHFSKIARTGEGGISLTNNKSFDEDMKILRSQGKVKNEDLSGDDLIEKSYYHKLLGFNYRMLDLQAAIGIPQIRKIDKNIAVRKRIAKVYMEEFKKYEIETFNPEKGSEPSYWVYPAIFKSRAAKLIAGRELIKKKMPFRSFFWPCHKQPFYDSSEELAVTEDISGRGIVLPCNTSATEQEARALAKIIGSAVKDA